MNAERRTIVHKKDLLEASAVPEDIQNKVHLLLLQAKSHGCTCDPEVSVSAQPDEELPSFVAHDDWCAVWTTGRNAVLHGEN